MILKQAIMQVWLKKRIMSQRKYLTKHKQKLTQELAETNNERLIDTYISRLTDYTMKKEVERAPFPTVPFVMIDSRVVFYDTNYKWTKAMTVCYPEQANEEIGYLSFLSPLGQQFLLREVGDRFVYNDNCYKIQHIEYSPSS